MRAEIYLSPRQLRETLKNFKLTCTVIAVIDTHQPLAAEGECEGNRKLSKEKTYCR